MSGLIDAKLTSQTFLKPRKVEQIVQASKEYEYNAQVPVRYWLRTAGALLKEADIYMREGDDETTYLLLFRHAHLVLAHLEAHPDARHREIKPLLAKARQEVDRNLKILDVLKPKINQRYERYTKIIQEREARKSAQSIVDGAPVGDSLGQPQNRKVQQLHGHENRDLAVQLAQQEFQRRAAVRGGTPQPRQRQIPDVEDLSQSLQAIRSQVDSGTPNQISTQNEGRSRQDASIAYNYPSIKVHQIERMPERSTQPHTRDFFEQASVFPPSIPPKPVSLNAVSVPPRPDKVRDIRAADSVVAKASAATTYTFAPTAFLENGNPLRTLFLPPTLRTTFLRIAHKNTMTNLETCGFLAGTLISNALFVSKLIIPAQIATSDTCEMTNESQLFDYVDSGADLMILGWIHTHPSQTCFMSSRDLHTHAGYQMMLPESVAIVCAPSKGDTTHGGDWGVYRLTDPPGKMAILNCTKPGVFHPHEVDNIYTDALRPGHVVEAKGLEFEVVDLRDS